MKLTRFIQLCLVGALTLGASPTVSAQKVIQNLSPLHVDGPFFKDENGNKVVLHGVMDTPNSYFNSNRWGGGYTEAGASNCCVYFSELFSAITDNSQGAYCSVFRLHLDPAWTNGSTAKTTQDAREAGDGEANITKYDGTRLDLWLSKLYTNIAIRAMQKHMYVIMRPPGVCPQNIYVGGSYQKFLLDVWDRVSKNARVQNWCGQVMLELANEPVNVYMNDGSKSDKALHDFFQPIVDKIRENGFKGIILVPGSGYQSGYASYAKYPITGENIGYAVHNYAGWYGTSDSSYDVNNSIKNFTNQVPITYTNPIVITEVDWSPEKQPREIKNYNEFGQPTYRNYGTWATASTSKWGKAYKGILDFFGNVSMTLTSTDDYIDYKDYHNYGKVTPAFKTAMEASGLDPYDGCGVACFDWYEQYAKENYASLERYQPIQEIPENPFLLKRDYFNTRILYENTATFASAATTIKFKANGFVGWRFEEEPGLDLTKYSKLTIKLARAVTGNVRFRLYDTSHYWNSPYEIALTNKGKEITIDLKDLTKKDGTALDLSKIRMAGFYSPTDNLTFFVTSVTLEADESSAIEAPKVATQQQKKNGAFYDLSGRQVKNPTRGIYIRDGKKVVVK